MTVRRRMLLSLAAVLCFGAALGPPDAAAQPPYIAGRVVNSVGVAIPGLTVQLQNQEVGPSAPTVTGPAGEYVFTDVPTQVRVPYFIEVWWGQRLVYRDIVPQLGQQSDIVLQ